MRANRTFGTFLVLLAGPMALLHADSESLIGESLSQPSLIVPGETLDGMDLPSSSVQPFLSPDRMATVLQNIKPENELVIRSGSGARIYQSVSPSVVLIVTDSALGTGALINAEGDIVTNWHVIEGASRVGVIFKPPREGDAISQVDIRRAEVRKIDEVADLALLRVTVVPAGRNPVRFGALGSVSIGADVHAIGHPSGESWTYTRGFVSQIRLGYQWRTESGVEHRADVIQTQTPINPGNSGGPLLDESGQLIGINSFKAAGEALNFAVSVDEVRAFLDRPEGRIAARVSARPAVADVCESRAVGRERRTVGGIPGEMAWVDGDCDGESDFQVFIPDDDLQPVSIFVDTNGDGRIDTIYFDTDRNGEVNISVMDTNGDGTPDLRGFHQNGDFEPYRVERMN